MVSAGSLIFDVKIAPGSLDKAFQSITQRLSKVTNVLIPVGIDNKSLSAAVKRVQDAFAGAAINAPFAGGSGGGSAPRLPSPAAPRSALPPAPAPPDSSALFKSANDGAIALSKSYGVTFGEARKLQEAIGLTGEQASKASGRYQELAGAGATTTEKFRILSKETGINREQFAALDKQLSVTTAGLGTVAAGSAALAAGIGATFAAGTKSFVEFDSAVRQSGAISGASAEGIGVLRDEVTRLGIVTSKTPQEIARTSISLSRAGFSAEEAAASLEGIARASEAAGTSLEVSGDIIAKTLRTFGLEAGQSERVADILVATANKSNTSIEGLGDSFRYVGATAAGSNQSLEGTATLLGILGDAGIQGCYDPETEILTQAGWKRWADVSMSDSLGTYNAESGQLEYQQPLRLIRYWHSGKMYRVLNRNIDLMVTPDHRMYVKRVRSGDWGVERATDIEGKSVKYLRGGLKWAGVTPEFYTLEGFAQNRGSWVKHVPPVSVEAITWAQFLGLYLSEGHCDYIKGTYRTIITQNHGVKRDEMRAMLAKLPFSFYETKTGFVFTNEQLYRQVCSFGKSWDKFAPAYLKEWGVDALTAFYETYRLGDGDENGAIYTCSVQMRDDIEEIILKCGWAASHILKNDSSKRTQMKDGRLVQSRRNHWKINVNREQLTPAFNQDDYRGKHGERLSNAIVKPFEGWVDYSGEVFCAEVPNHLLIVRRGGKSIVSGNSQAGTNLASALQRLKIASAAGNSELAGLARGSARAASALQIIGGDVRNADGSMKDLVDIIPKLRSGLSNLSQEDQDIVTKTLFGEEGGRAIQTILNRTQDGITSLNNEIVNSEGVARATSEEMLKGLGGAINLLGGSVQAAIISFGQLVAVGLDPAARVAIFFLNRFNELPFPIKAAAGALVGLTGVLAAGTAALATYNILGGQTIVNEAAKAAAFIFSGQALNGKTIAQLKDVAIQSTSNAVTVTTAAINKLAAAQITGVQFALVGKTLASLRDAAVEKGRIGLEVAAAAIRKAKLIALGQETIAINATTTASIKALGTLGLFAGAAASVALVADSFLSVTAETRRANAALDEVRDAAIAQAEAQAKAAQGTADGVAAVTSVAQQNAQKLADSLNPIQKGLDAIRELVGLSTGLESLGRNAAIAFDQVTDATLETRLSASQVAADIEAGLTVDPSVVSTTVDRIDAQVKALEQLAAPTEAAVTQKQALIASLETLKGRLQEGADGVETLGQAYQELPSAIERATSQIDTSGQRLDRTQAIDQAALDARKADLLKSGGDLEQIEAQIQADQIAQDIKFAEERLQAAVNADIALQKVRSDATSTEELFEINEKILANDQTLAQARSALFGAQSTQRRAQLQSETDAVQEAFEKQEAANEAAAAATDRFVSERTLAIREQQIAGTIGAEDAANRITEIEAEAIQQRISQAQSEYDQIAALRAQGVISEEDATKRQNDAVQQISDLRLQAAEASVAAQEAANDARLASLERSNAEAQAATDRYLSEQTLAIKEQQLAGTITAEEAQRQITDIEAGAIQQRLDQAQAEYNQVAQLRAEGVLSADEAAAAQIDSIRQISDLRLQAVDSALKAQEDIRKAEEATQKQAIEAIEKRTQLEKQANDARLANLAAIGDSYSTEAKLLQSNSDLAALRGQKEQEILETRIAQATASGNEASAEKLQNDLLKLQAEQEKESFEAKRAQVEIQIQQNNLEAQRALLTAQSAAAEAEANILKREAEGASQAELEILGQLADAAARQVGNAERNIGVTELVNANLRETVDLEEDIANENRKQANGGRSVGGNGSAPREFTREGFNNATFSSADVFQERANNAARSQRRPLTAARSLSQFGSGFVPTELDPMAGQLTERSPAFANGAPSAPRQNFMEQGMELFAANIAALVNRPTTLVVQTPDPVSDAARVNADLARRAAKGAKL